MISKSLSLKAVTTQFEGHLRAENRTQQSRLWFFLLLFLLARGAYCEPSYLREDLNRAEQRAVDISYNAGVQGRSAEMEAGQAILNSITCFRTGFASSLQLKYDELNGQEKALFDKIRDSIETLREPGAVSANQVKEITDSLTATVSSLRFDHDLPRVTGISGLYSVEGSNPATKLVVTGINLSNHGPVLEVAGKEYKPDSKSDDSELTFRLPTIATERGKPMLIPAKLQLFQRTGIFFGFAEVTYPLRLAIYPRRIGDVTVIPRREIPVEETRSFVSPPYRCESPHGTGSRVIPVNVSASPGWTIVTDSIRYDRSYSNNGSFTMLTVSAAGFTASLSCSGFGRLSGPFGVTIDSGNQGVEQGVFSYVETRLGIKLEDGAAKHVDVQWSETTVVSDLPNDTKTTSVILKAISGETLQVSGGGSNRFLRVQYDQAAKRLTISAASLEQALQQ